MTLLREMDGDEDVGAHGSTQKATGPDRHVGSRIRERRVMLGLSQQQLARMIGVTYQQAHKYERGLNRISAGRLFEVAQVLGVPVAWFFEGLEGEGEPAEASPRQRRGLELARNFALIDNERHQEALSQMARVLAEQSQAERRLSHAEAEVAANGTLINGTLKAN